MNVRVLQTHRIEPCRRFDDQHGTTRKISVVEVWINGICFKTDATDDEHARQLVVTTCKALGLT